jgi:hypothetical protein
LVINKIKGIIFMFASALKMKGWWVLKLLKWWNLH